MGTAKVSGVPYLRPIYLALIARLVLGELIVVQRIIGLGLILPGIYRLGRRTAA